MLLISGAGIGTAMGPVEVEELPFQALPMAEEDTGEGRAIDSDSQGFIVNDGQFPDAGVVAYGNLPGGGIAFAEGRVMYSILEPTDRPAVEDLRKVRDKEGWSQRNRPWVDAKVEGCTVVLNFDGANPVKPRVDGPLPGLLNFYLGDDPAMWRTEVRRYTQVVYEDLYYGIDLVYKVIEGKLKYEFYVRPGTDPGIISIRLEGHDDLRVEDDDLVITTLVGDICDTDLELFYKDAPWDRVEGSFRVDGEDTYGFLVPDRDAGRTLVIDPTVYSTLLGSNRYDVVRKVQVDSAGNAYVTGFTNSDNFPTSAGAYQESLSSSYDAFVTKLSTDGSSLMFSTFIGGDSIDAGFDLCLDDINDIYIIGITTSGDFPTSAGAFQDVYQGNGNTFMGFVSKLRGNGQQMEYSTYLGSNGEEWFNGIDVDASGNAFCVGSTDSKNFPTTADAYQSQRVRWEDAVVCKLDARGSKLLYASCLGAGRWDEAYDVKVNATGAFYVAGLTYSSGFPITPGAFQGAIFGATTSGFVTKFKADGSDLVYSTFLGGSEDQELYALDVNEEGNATVVGYTYSTDFPVTTGAYQGRLKGYEYDAFVSMLSSDGSSLVYSTFLGGHEMEVAHDVAISDDGRFHVVGTTSSTAFPTSLDASQTRLKGYSDGFIAVLNANMTDLDYGSYLGGGKDENANGVAPLGTLSTIIVGDCESTYFPTSQGAYQTAFGGGNLDGFITKMTFDPVRPIADAGPDVAIDQGKTVWFNGTESWDNVAVVKYTWRFSYGGSSERLVGPLVSFTFDEVGFYPVILTVRDASGLGSRDTMNVTVRDITPPEAKAGMNRYLSQGDRLTFDGRGSSDNWGISKHTWTFVQPGGVVTLYGAQPSFTFLEAGDFNVTLNVTDFVGLWATDSLWVHVRDITPPVANAGPDLEIDQYEEVTFTGDRCSDNVAIVNWTWSFLYGEQPIKLDGEVQSYTFEEVGNYLVTLAVEDANGGRAVDNFVVRVRDITIPTAKAGPDQTVDQGETVTFDATASSDNVRIPYYNWSFVFDGVPITMEGTNPTFNFNLAGTFEVTLLVTDPTGLTDVDTVTITVSDSADPNVDAGDDIEVDQHETVVLDGTGSRDNIAITEWAWIFDYEGSQIVLEDPQTSYTFDEAGDYEVTLFVADAAGNSASVTITVTVWDTTEPIADPGGDVTVDQDITFTLDGSASTDNVGIVTHRWTFEHNGAPVTIGGPVMEYTIGTPGTYEITLTVIDGADNKAQRALILKVRDTIAPVMVSMSDKTVKTGEKLVMAESGSYDNVAIVRWTWTFKEGGKNVELEGERVEHTFDEAGDYKVILELEDADGNTATESFTVTVEGNTWIYVALFVIVIVVAVAMFVFKKRKTPKTIAYEEKVEAITFNDSEEDKSEETSFK
jgi:PKD repeat protein